MDTPTALACYRQIRELTGRMLEAARAGDWDTLVELEAGRRAAVEAVTNEPVVFGALASERDAIIRAILQADQEIADLVRAWRTELNGMLASLAAQRKLERVYRPG